MQRKLHTHAALEEFEQRIQSYPELMKYHLMMGTFDSLVCPVVPDLQSYKRFLTEKLTRLPGVGNLPSSFRLKQVIYNTGRPIAAG
ncbi:MAG: Lrp/AsnC ligand binding domain-containing protein [Pseudomonadota bacterium]